MMHLKYPRRRGFFHWDELGCLARALGFHEEIFLHSLPDDFMIDKLGLSLSTLLDVLDLHKYLHPSLDQTYNNHTDEWNISAIRRAVHLLDRRVFTFEEIEVIRITYQVYESSDTRGLHLHEKTLQRVIKMCGRMISPLKMMQRVKHMAQDFEESDRIQLHELFDLLLWCELYQGIQVEAAHMNIMKDDRELFGLEDFAHMLSYYDQRLANDLDLKYMQEELKFTKQKFTSKAMPKDIPPVDQQVRKKQVGYHKEKYKFLHREIFDSSVRVAKSRAGHVRGRPLSAPDVMMFQYTDPSMSCSTLHPRPRSVQDLFGHIIRPTTAQSAPSSLSSRVPRPQVEFPQHPKTPRTVSETDVIQCQEQIKSLKFETELIDSKYQQLLNEDLDYLVPGYRERKANKPKPPPPPPTPKPKAPARPSPETINKLADPRKSHLPSPAHARLCDARHRGWYGVKTRSGPHFVLTSMQYDPSPTGTMLAKLRESSDSEINRKPIVYRYTQQNQVVQDVPRPWSSPVAVVITRPWSSPAAMTVTQSYYPADQPDTDTKSTVQTNKSECINGDKLSNKDVSSSVDVTRKQIPDAEKLSETSSIYHQEKPDEQKLSISANSGDGGISPDITRTCRVPLAWDFQSRGICRTGCLSKLEELDEREVRDKEATNQDNLQEEFKLELDAQMLINKSEISSTARVVNTELKSSKNSERSIVNSGRVSGLSNADVFYSWYSTHKKANDYPWIEQIIKTDYGDLWQEQRKKFDFKRLVNRGIGITSKKCQQKLSTGIPV